MTLIAAGCSSTKETSKQTAKSVNDYEKEFDPKKYNPDQKKTPQKEFKNPDQRQDEAVKTTIDRFEKIPGFRVQIYSTADVDEAMQKKDYYQASLDSMKIYLVYDAPYYKIRVGDFNSKDQANAIKSLLRERGMNEAWVVPDQVFRVE